jgi:hypothetical protein
MIYTEPLFLGVTPTGARNYVASNVASCKKPFFNACAGRFSVVEAAIKAGIPPQNVFASDIGLFSSIIGYLADPSKKLDDLGIRILDPALEPKGLANDLDFAAHVMLILNLSRKIRSQLGCPHKCGGDWKLLRSVFVHLPCWPPTRPSQ